MIGPDGKEMRTPDGVRITMIAIREDDRDFVLATRAAQSAPCRLHDIIEAYREKHS